MKIHYGSIDMIHPTQITVGYSEVAVKMDELMKYQKDGTLAKYLKTKVIPCVLGPDSVIYITDHHHMGLALTVLANEWDKENLKKERSDNPFVHCSFNILYDFAKSKLPRKEFFKVLDTLNFLHPNDEHGVILENKNIPKRLIDLKNDSYRSLAGFVRKSGGYNKVPVPYTEFIWADFFRLHITQEEIEKNLKKSIIKGISLALSDEAQHLPGWKGIEILNGLKSTYIEQIKANKKLINESATQIAESIDQAKVTMLKPKAIKFK